MEVLTCRVSTLYSTHCRVSNVYPIAFSMCSWRIALMSGMGMALQADSSGSGSSPSKSAACDLRRLCGFDQRRPCNEGSGREELDREAASDSVISASVAGAAIFVHDNSAR